MIRAFVEAPAGLAAVSLRLHGGQHCRPPISRMGNKAGYAEVILAALGLRSGEGAGAYVWAESDPNVRALLRAYPDASMLRRIAEIIRGWKDEEPRALWERLRAERRARGPAVDDEGAAGWIVTGGWSFRAGEPESGFRDPYGGFSGSGRDGGSDTITLAGLTDRCHRLAEYASIVAEPAAAWAWLQSRSVGGIPASEGLPFYGPTMPAGDPKDALRGRRVATCDGVAQGFERVAGWIQIQATSGKSERFFDPVKAGLGATDSKGREWGTDNHWWAAARCDRLASHWPPVAVLATIPDAATLSAMLGTPGDLDGVVIYSDPDYRDTTGYLATCREMIPDLARGWDAAGAVVCISEAEPLPELAGWFAAEISAGRRGQKRTFSKQQREVLTMNREPAHRVATQQRMFGG